MTILVMIDLETLSTDTNAVVTQVAIVAVDKDDPETVHLAVHEYLPIDPQLTLGRRISGSTLLWWMKQDDAAREVMQRSSGDDMGELEALTRSIHHKLERLQTLDQPIEIWARGPQFDVVILESLFAALELAAPWKYSSVRDLRTMMGLAGVTVDSVDNTGLTKHNAMDDCVFQLRCYTEANRIITNV